jgi:excinuclease UvrABC nuclease subunit
MEKAVKNLDFMEAAKYRDLIIALEERIWELRTKS